MKINILTLFPEMFVPLQTSMLGRACENGILEIKVVDIRDYTLDKHNRVDEYPFGGGAGMLMQVEPIDRALTDLGAENKNVLYMSPRGRIIDKAKIEEISRDEEIYILCGHYEGVDQRAIDLWDMEELSIGDYVLTGGELAAMVLVDAVSRCVPGVLGDSACIEEESVYSGLLEHPQYTKPREYKGLSVPEVLLSGHHKNIAQWKLDEAIKLTAERRPDLLEKYYEKQKKNHEKNDDKFM
ncbi:MAG: tRNA (guanosine(37)-N1)-methyltransferase TrmD [Eubacteriales bacterium]|nr:tRNA (guanosine(37)-N1)-methyltransferase TrmD [Eubacteriales bacterium]MDY3333132.1 tRNA (guanosine(37)-N1)-methyltransferase TrmD [Gallibacter sp.]